MWPWWLLCKPFNSHLSTLLSWFILLSFLQYFSYLGELNKEIPTYIIYVQDLIPDLKIAIKWLLIVLPNFRGIGTLYNVHFDHFIFNRDSSFCSGDKDRAGRAKTLVLIACDAEPFHFDTYSDPRIRFGVKQIRPKIEKRTAFLSDYPKNNLLLYRCLKQSFKRRKILNYDFFL